MRKRRREKNEYKRSKQQIELYELQHTFTFSGHIKPKRQSIYKPVPAFQKETSNRKSEREEYYKFGLFVFAGESAFDKLRHRSPQAEPAEAGLAKSKGSGSPRLLSLPKQQKPD